jgi:hypothetical protein
MSSLKRNSLWMRSIFLMCLPCLCRLHMSCCPHHECAHFKCLVCLRSIHCFPLLHLRNAIYICHKCAPVSTVCVSQLSLYRRISCGPLVVRRGLSTSLIYYFFVQMWFANRPYEPLVNDTNSAALSLSPVAPHAVLSIQLIQLRHMHDNHPLERLRADVLTSIIAFLSLFLVRYGFSTVSVVA